MLVVNKGNLQPPPPDLVRLVVSTLTGVLAVVVATLLSTKRVRVRIAGWHWGQLLILCVGVAALEFLTLRALKWDVVAPIIEIFDPRADLAELFGFTSAAARFAGRVRVSLAVWAIGLPVGLFVVGWIWFGRRRP